MDLVTYPFLFIALYFEAFLLLTFLSSPAREQRKNSTVIATATPKVAIIVPCWNEESTVAGTVESLLALDYPADKLSLVLVNDGSTDGTAAAIDRFATHPQVTAIHKENGGKFTAMNLALEHVGDAEFVGFLDADSFVAPDALREIVAGFTTGDTAAVTASMSIHEPRTLLQRMQYAEYTFSIMLRHVFSSINGLYVTPGPFSFYRYAALKDLGPFKHAYLAEDMEMAMRIQRAGLKIGNALRARVYTKGPATLPKLIKQRTRWTTGFIRNLFFDYRDLIGGKKNAVLGILVLPLGILAIGGGILLFVFELSRLVEHGFHVASVAQAAPLSYAFTIHSFTWFYLPITFLTVAGLLLATSNVVWMSLGKNLSKTPGSLTLNVVPYLFLYVFVAPLWLITSVSHVALGTRTVWR